MKLNTRNNLEPDSLSLNAYTEYINIIYVRGFIVPLFHYKYPLSCHLAKEKKETYNFMIQNGFDQFYQTSYAVLNPLMLFLKPPYAVLNTKLYKNKNNFQMEVFIRNYGCILSPQTS
jgi:hypothetical protein